MRQLLLIAMLATGCAGRFGMPGPLRTLGRTAAPAQRTSAPTRAPDAVFLSVDDSSSRGTRRQTASGHEIAQAARHYLNHSLDGYRDDCSGFVLAAVNRTGRVMNGNTASLWADMDNDGSTHHRNVPQIGDFAFFDNTYDRNRDGRNNDDLTHIGIVVDVDEDGTITLAHGGTSAGRSELTFNLTYPNDHQATDGAVINDYLRRRRSSDRSGTPYLAGQMWRGFATVQD
ncbi:MAG: hypothetical protein ACJAZO_001771 [Myxococcota bacterium]|jgi:hypothetical protein